MYDCPRKRKARIIEHQPFDAQALAPYGARRDCADKQSRICVGLAEVATLLGPNGIAYCVIVRRQDSLGQVDLLDRVMHEETNRSSPTSSPDFLLHSDEAIIKNLPTTEIVGAHAFCWHRDDRLARRHGGALWDMKSVAKQGITSSLIGTRQDDD